MFSQTLLKKKENECRFISFGLRYVIKDFPVEHAPGHSLRELVLRPLFMWRHIVWSRFKCVLLRAYTFK